MSTCFLAMGSNLGNRRRYIRLALEKISKLKGSKIIKISKIIETNPCGCHPGQNKFLNAVLKIDTKLPPAILLKELQKIENKLGRKRLVRFGPRTIDLDILFYGNRVICRKNLEIPHPRMFERDFVLKPLAEVL